MFGSVFSIISTIKTLQTCLAKNTTLIYFDQNYTKCTRVYVYVVRQKKKNKNSINYLNRPLENLRKILK